VQAHEAADGSPDAPVRWAVAGSSEYALDWVAPGILAASGAELTAIVTRDPARAGASAERLGVRHVVTSIGELAGVADAVHLVSPNELHAPQAVEAARAGLHVLVEKPMEMTVDACRPMVDAAAEAGVLLTVGSCMAWAPPVARAVELVASGAIGTPLHALVQAGFDSPPSGVWRQELPTARGGGPLYDLGAHAVDALIRLLGPVTGVSAHLANVRHSYAAEDSAGLLLVFGSGATAAVQLSFAGELNALRVNGSEGRLDSEEWLGRTFAGELTLTTGARGVGRFDGEDSAGRRSEALAVTDLYAAQAAEVSAAIRGGPAPRNGAGIGVAVVAVLEAAVRSAAEGRWVALNDTAVAAG
jgi:1,5-anhydro-D-fructose reductase (1,5-anhydro-D-mannitol-forming)